MSITAQRLKQPFTRMFDTHKYIKLFKSKGIKESQAEAFVQAISDSLDANLANLATKDHIYMLDKRIDKLEEEMKEIRQDIKCIHQEIKTVLYWVIGAVIGLIGAMTAILSYVMPLIKH